MKRVARNKLLFSTKIVGRLFRSREKVSEMDGDTLTSTKEIDALKDQIENLKAAVNTLQEDADKKDLALAKLAHEKEKLTCDLLKQRRVNKNLTKQLEDERSFYFKEKENFCQEMNEYKKLRASLSSSNVTEDSKKSVSDYKAQIVKLKQTLSQTLTANYNLSIKFLRMKNTKSFLKHELKNLHHEHEKVVKEMKQKLQTLTTEMCDVLELKIDATLSPSNKKYLQVVKQNSSLMYENLCLQLEADRLNLKLDKMKLYKTKSETNSRLLYLRSEYCPNKIENASSGKAKKESKRVRLEIPGKVKKKILVRPKEDEKVVKIFERLEKPDTPVPVIMPSTEKCHTEEDNKVKQQSKKHHHGKSHSKKHKSQKNKECKTNINTNDSTCFPVEPSDSKLTLLQVSESQASSEFNVFTSTVVSTTEISETQSAPNIVQSDRLQVCETNSCKEVDLLKT